MRFDTGPAGSRQAILDESRRGNRPRHACGAPARKLLSIHRVLELLALGRWADVGGIRGQNRFQRPLVHCARSSGLVWLCGTSQGIDLFLGRKTHRLAPQRGRRQRPGAPAEPTSIRRARSPDDLRPRTRAR